MTENLVNNNSTGAKLKADCKYEYGQTHRKMITFPLDIKSKPSCVSSGKAIILFFFFVGARSFVLTKLLSL